MLATINYTTMHTKLKLSGASLSMRETLEYTDYKINVIWGWLNLLVHASLWPQEYLVMMMHEVMINFSYLGFLLVDQQSEESLIMT